MNRRFVLVPIAALALTSFALGVRADPDRPLSFAIANHTDQTLDSLSISFHSARIWRPVTMDHGPIAAGARGNAKVDPADRQCEFDVRADFHGGTSTEQDGVNLCTLRARTLDLQ
ncbi:MAG TPA: hypothetical protein VG407_11520 [Caulobacteraceae bacterium]|jgi:hypothetical protein|nr:hypothetical protein [Caulobacteraceae bacterium]